MLIDFFLHLKNSKLPVSTLKSERASTATVHGSNRQPLELHNCFPSATCRQPRTIQRYWQNPRV